MINIFMAGLSLGIAIWMLIIIITDKERKFWSLFLLNLFACVYNLFIGLTK